MGQVISHGGDVYYMSPGEAYGKFLCQGVKRANGTRARRRSTSRSPRVLGPRRVLRGVQTRSGKRISARNGSRPISSSPDAFQYRVSQLKYFLYGRKRLKQVFDFVKSENIRTGSQG